MPSPDLQARGEIIEQLVKLRPDSSIVHLLAAETYALRRKDDEASRQLIDLHLEKARSSDPSSAPIRASYGNRLFVQERFEEALTELDHLLKDYPESRFFQLLRLRTLEKSDRKTAAAYGASIAAVMEQNASYWYTMGRVHQELGQHDLAVEAVRRAFVYDRKRGVLAWTLAKAGRLDEAEEQYRSNLAEHDCQWCWFHFAKFLVERRPDRRADALDAIENAASRAGQKLISDEEIESLRERVKVSGRATSG